MTRSSGRCCRPTPVARVDAIVVESVEDGTGTSPVDASGVFSVVAPVGPVRFGVRVDGALRRTPWVVLRPGAQEG